MSANTDAASFRRDLNAFSNRLDVFEVRLIELEKSIDDLLNRLAKIEEQLHPKFSPSFQQFLDIWSFQRPAEEPDRTTVTGTAGVSQPHYCTFCRQTISERFHVCHRIAP